MFSIFLAYSDKCIRKITIMVALVGLVAFRGGAFISSKNENMKLLYNFEFNGFENKKIAQNYQFVNEFEQPNLSIRSIRL